MRRIILIIPLFLIAAAALAQERVSFATADGGLVHADLYGKGGRAVVLAHGARFNRESWKEQARVLERAGFRVLAIDFRGYGESRGPGDSDALSAPLHLDVLAAVRFLRSTGSDTVSVVGGSMGGAAAADAAIEAEAGEISGVVVLAALPDGPPEEMKGRTLFVVARDDVSGAGPRLPGIRAYYERVRAPKELLILDGSAHAQHLFATAQGDQLMQEIVLFLSCR